MIGIVDLVSLCVAQQRWSQRLFERCGTWVATTERPDLQQFLAVAAHRHAWHAELWSERRPTIPVADPAPASDRREDTPAGGDDGRVAHYRDELQAMLAALDSARASADASLDPATHRTLDLVTHDLTNLYDRLGALAP